MNQVYGLIKGGPDYQLISGKGIYLVDRISDGVYAITIDSDFWFAKPPAITVTPLSQYVTAQAIVKLDVSGQDSKPYDGSTNFAILTGFSDAGIKDIPYFSFIAIGESLYPSSNQTDAQST